MTSNEDKKPSGERREVSATYGVTIGGAPLTYIAMLAAVIAALSLIPFSPLLGIGGFLTFSDIITPQPGLLLGPWGGAVTSLVGILLTSFLPNASPFTIFTAIGSGIAALAVGLVVQRDKNWWLYGWVGALACWLVYIGLAVSRDIPLSVAIPNSAVHIVALLIWISPLRRMAVDWLKSTDVRKLAAGVAIVFWIGTVTEHLVNTTILYYMLNWTVADWIYLIGIIPLERLGLTAAATVVCTGVIVGMRRIGLPRPEMAGW